MFIFVSDHFLSFQVLAKVVRTGFYTAKGELIKSILFPKQLGFQFYNDAVKFVMFMFCIAAIGMAYSIWLYVLRGVSVYITMWYNFSAVKAFLFNLYARKVIANLHRKSVPLMCRYALAIQISVIFRSRFIL